MLGLPGIVDGGVSPGGVSPGGVSVVGVVGAVGFLVSGLGGLTDAGGLLLHS